MNGGARRHVEAAQVSIAGRQTEVVAEDDQVAVVSRVRGRDDLPVSGRIDGLTFFRGDVEPLVEGRFARERVRTPTEISSEPSVCGPDRRRGSGECFLTLNVLANISEAIFEALQERSQDTKCVLRRAERRRDDVGNSGARFGGSAS